MMIAERLLALVLVAVGLTTTWLILRLWSRRIRQAGAADVVVKASGLPVILAFSTIDCVPCKTIQRPALEELLGRFPDRVTIRDVDATAEPAMTRRFGILTVPSTVVIGESGTIVAINQGPARWQKLAGQLRLNGGGK